MGISAMEELTKEQEEMMDELVRMDILGPLVNRSSPHPGRFKRFILGLENDEERNDTRETLLMVLGIAITMVAVTIGLIVLAFLFTP